jgi:hypothetical protein
VSVHKAQLGLPTGCVDVRQKPFCWGAQGGSVMLGLHTGGWDALLCWRCHWLSKPCGELQQVVVDAHDVDVSWLVSTSASAVE